MNIRENFYEEFKEYLQTIENYYVALSGGVDSVVMLHLLKEISNKFPIKISAVHINHNINENADNWHKWCTDFCKKLDIKIYTHKLQVNWKNQDDGIEGAARKYRYEYLSKYVQKDCALITAHHKDDQCETFILSLKRGSGPKGLSSMPRIIPFGKGYLIRPFLIFSKEEILNYAKNNNITWVEDISNKCCKFDRNFIRNKVMPVIKERWPFFCDSVSRSAFLCAEQENLLDELLAEDLNKMTYKGTLSWIPLTKMSFVRKNAILRRWLSSYNVILSFNQISQFWKDFSRARYDLQPCFRINNKVIRKFKNRLYCTNILKSVEERLILWKEWHIKLELPSDLGSVLIKENIQEVYKNHLKVPKPCENVKIKFGLKENVYLDGFSLRPKKFWQKMNIPPWDRDRIPILYYDDILIAIGGIYVNENIKCMMKDTIYYFIWENPYDKT